MEILVGQAVMSITIVAVDLAALMRYRNAQTNRTRMKSEIQNRTANAKPGQQRPTATHRFSWFWFFASGKMLFVGVYKVLLRSRLPLWLRSCSVRLGVGCLTWRSEGCSTIMNCSICSTQRPARGPFASTARAECV